MFPHSPENQPCPGLHQKKHVSGFMSKEPNSFSFWVAPSFLSYFSDENCMPRCGRTWSEKISPFPIATTLKHMKTNQTFNRMSSLSDGLSHLNPKSKRSGGLFSLNTVKNIRLCREHVTAPFSTNARKSSSHECKRKRSLALRYSSTITVICIAHSVLKFPLNAPDTVTEKQNEHTCTSGPPPSWDSSVSHRGRRTTWHLVRQATYPSHQHLMESR